MSWELVPCLAQLRREIDAIAPGRDRASDGTIGDDAHQGTVSDHNDDEVGRVPIRDADKKREVHAYDADADLRTPGLMMRNIVDHIVARCRAGNERRLRYVIFDGMIWQASNGWRKRAHTGPNPHRGHAHFSASYDTEHEADTVSWRLEDIPIMLTDADKKWLATEIDKAATAAAERVWKQRLNIAVKPGAKASLQEAGSILRYTSPEHHAAIDGIARVERAIEDIKANLPGKVETPLAIKGAGR